MWLQLFSLRAVISWNKSTVLSLELCLYGYVTAALINGKGLLFRLLVKHIVGRILVIGMYIDLPMSHICFPSGPDKQLQL